MLGAGLAGCLRALVAAMGMGQCECGAYRTATLSFLSMCRRLWTLVDDGYRVWELRSYVVFPALSL